jgi:crossover junction endodeoxyribonuclease RusA
MIKLTLPYPISANRYWASRIITPRGTKRAMALTYVTPEAKEYKAQVAMMAASQGASKIVGRVAIEIELYPNRPLDYKKRMRDLGDAWDDSVQCIDLGNCEKVLSDALKDVLFGDDKLLHDIHLKRMEPDGEARVVVTLTPYVRTAVSQPSLLLGAAA